MKMKLSEIEPKLRGLMSLKDLKLPPKLGYAVSYNLEKLQAEYERIEKQRIKICENLAVKDEEGNPVMVEVQVGGAKAQKYKFPSDEEEKICNQEYRELLEGETEIDFRMGKWEDLEKCESSDRYSLPTVAHIQAMDFVLEK